MLIEVVLGQQRLLKRLEGALLAVQKSETNFGFISMFLFYVSEKMVAVGTFVRASGTDEPLPLPFFLSFLLWRPNINRTFRFFAGQWLRHVFAGNVLVQFFKVAGHEGAEGAADRVLGVALLRHLHVVDPGENFHHILNKVMHYTVHFYGYSAPTL